MIEPDFAGPLLGSLHREKLDFPLSEFPVAQITRVLSAAHFKIDQDSNLGFHSAKRQARPYVAFTVEGVHLIACLKECPRYRGNLCSIELSHV